MEALLNVAESTVRKIYHNFLYLEFFVHIVGICISATFLALFSRLRPVHINLFWILNSFVISFCITTVWRIYYCAKLLISDIEPGHEALSLSADLRDTSMYAAGLHMLLLSAERQLATVRSGTYENESHILPICIAIVCTWLFSYFVVTFLREQLFTNFASAFIFLIIYGISILIMLHVRTANFSKWKKHRGTLQFSQSYQVRENVTSARYLYTCFVVFSVQTIIGWICLVVYLVFKRVHHVPILEKTFGFAFDILLASQTTTIPLVIFFNNDKLKSHVQRLMNCSTATNRTNYIIDLEGRNMKVQNKDETKTYFEQLSDAWS